MAGQSPEGLTAWPHWTSRRIQLGSLAAAATFFIGLNDSRDDFSQVPAPIFPFK
jgi:hypothetical protein